jgi:hypothetical protein
MMAILHPIKEDSEVMKEHRREHVMRMSQSWTVFTSLYVNKLLLQFLKMVFTLMPIVLILNYGKGRKDRSLPYSLPVLYHQPSSKFISTIAKTLKTSQWDNNITILQATSVTKKKKDPKHICWYQQGHTKSVHMVS